MVPEDGAVKVLVGLLTEHFSFTYYLEITGKVCLMDISASFVAHIQKPILKSTGTLKTVVSVSSVKQIL